MILTEANLLSRLRELTAQAERIDVATAWAGPGKAQEAILGSSAKVRAIIGITGFATHPTTLREFQRKGVDLRIPAAPPLFHPKLVLFHFHDRTVCWIGSANLTFGGFELNRELVSEQDDDGSATAWFESLWASLDATDVKFTIQNYEDNWRPPTPGKRGQTGKWSGDARASIESSDWLSGVEDWRSFVAALNASNAYFAGTQFWSVYGDVASWLNTISLGNVIACREDWDNLSYLEYRVLMGIEFANEQSAYGLLGSMRGAGRAKEIFHKNTADTRRIRRGIRGLLQPVISANRDNFAARASTFLAEVSNIDRIGGSVATRLITLARPDLGISVNKGSRERLSNYVGLPPGRLALPPKLNRAVSYASLLDILNTKDWYRNPEPTNQFERTLADNRGALLDALVYRPT